ncbi:hypothetical protein CK936_28155 [Streptomyces albireticuli]|uniref:Uncharacterized protein n=1 Tax=Streptomyces albireticuli TaxID=1940 RepID=A0A2A2D2A4_9ACTN|nr:hypothetical protein CK936_28155 [Streptomyces albireticuli]
MPVQSTCSEPSRVTHGALAARGPADAGGAAHRTSAAADTATAVRVRDLLMVVTPTPLSPRGPYRGRTGPGDDPASVARTADIPLTALSAACQMTV